MCPSNSIFNIMIPSSCLPRSNPQNSMNIELSLPEKALTRPRTRLGVAWEDKHLTTTQLTRTSSESRSDRSQYRREQYFKQYFRTYLPNASDLYALASLRFFANQSYNSDLNSSHKILASGTTLPLYYLSNECMKNHRDQRPSIPGISAVPAIVMADPPQRQRIHRRKTSQPIRMPGARESAHKQRVQEILSRLSPIAGKDQSDCSHVFVCWGSKSQCKILAVRIPNSADEAIIWQMVREAWFSAQGRWRMIIPVFGVRDVFRVKIAIAGRAEEKASMPQDDVLFTGICEQIDSTIVKARYETEIREYEPQEWSCPYDPSTGHTICYNYCVSNSCDMTCPERVLYNARRQLLRVRMQSFLKLAFLDRAVSTCNDLLRDNNLIYGHQSILAATGKWHCPRLGELDLEALYIETAQVELKFLLPTCFFALVLSVPLTKLIFGDWAIAWGAGSFWVALIALMAYLWNSNTDSE